MKINFENIENIFFDQSFLLDDGMNIVYGFNNAGKTMLIKQSMTFLYNEDLKKILSGYSVERNYNYLPTNRILLRDMIYKPQENEDDESYVNYIKNKSSDYDIHLSRIHFELKKNLCVNEFMNNKIKDIFNEDFKNILEYYTVTSDGIKNVINIYLELIWTVLNTRRSNPNTLDELIHILKNTSCLYLIDEIEMFLHVSIQEKLLQHLREDFESSTFLVTTHAPLLLSRLKDISTFEIDKKKIKKNEENLYYSNLDKIYEVYFHVNDIPDHIHKDLNYLHKIIDNKVRGDLEEIDRISKNLRDNYFNVFEKYNKLIVFAKRKCDENV